MTTILVVQLPTATAEEMRRLADIRPEMRGLSLHDLGGFLLQAVVEMAKEERKRERVG